MRKLLSTVSGIVAAGALALISAAGAVADPVEDRAGWLSIGIPDQVQDEAVGGPEGSGTADGSFLGTTSEFSRFSVRGGRINPSLGLAWDRTAGLYGMRMTGEPEPSDLFSFSTGLKFDPPGWGSHSLSGQTLLIDRSAQQSGFRFQDHDPLRQPLEERENADPSSSFNLVLEGGGLPILPELTYHLALINPSSAGDAETGSGFAAGLTTRFNFGRGLSVSPMIEAARLTDPTGAKDRERQYWSTSMLTEWRNWNLGLSYTQRETELRADATRAHQAEASIGYVFDFGLTAGLGWYHLEEQNQTTDQFGLRFTYPFRLGK